MSTKPTAHSMGLNPPPVQPSATPPSQPILPSSWQATAIMHPFSPPPGGDQDKWPFFELCIANIAYVEDRYLSVQLLGTSNRIWWFITAPNPGDPAVYLTEMSTDQGATWEFRDLGWDVPSTNWVAKGRYFASGPLNWMEGAPSVDWWTQPAPATDPKATPAIWIWFDSIRQLPVRMMFGAPPPTCLTGLPGQLALFQNFSFTYFPTFEAQTFTTPPTWSTPALPNFNFGNPGLDLFVWNSNFGMSPMMTPVNASSNPLPTQVLYNWASDETYQVESDRAQKTTMSYEFNPPPPASAGPSDTAVDTVLMLGSAPAGMANPPPYAGNWFDYKVDNSGHLTCTMNPEMKMGAEAPDWVSTPGEQGQIWATVANDPVVSPNNLTAIYSVLFPPQPPQYPIGRFLWTWYSPDLATNGLTARPVTFMESASTVAEGGTSLALADYYDYTIFDDPIPPEIFAIPPVCLPSSAAPAAPAPSPTPAAPAPEPAPQRNFLESLLAALRRLFGGR